MLFLRLDNMKDEKDKKTINKEYENLMKKYFPDGMNGDMVLDCAFDNPDFAKFDKKNRDIL